MFGPGRITGIEHRLGQIKIGTEFLRLGLDGFLQRRNRRRRFFVADKQDTQVQIRLVETWLEFQDLAQLRNGLGILSLQAQGQREVEVRLDVGCIRGHGLAQQRLRHGRLVGVESLASFRQEVLLSQHENCSQQETHT